MVKRPEDYEYSGHRAYLGMDKSGLVDTEPVLRHFGGTKTRAIEVYRRFVETAMVTRSREEYYRAAEGRLLGSEEFLEDVRDRIGDYREAKAKVDPTTIEDLLNAAERSTKLPRQELCSKSKHRRTVAAREAIIIVGRERGITNRELAWALGIDPSAVTKRVEAAKKRKNESVDTVKLRKALKTKEQSR